MYLLVSDGERYVPLSRYLKGTVPELMRALFAVEKRFARLVRRSETGLFGRLLDRLGLRDRYLRLRALLGVSRAVRRQTRLGHLLKGRGVGKLWHGLCLLAGMLIGRKTQRLMDRHTTFHEVLQVIVLPFEDNSVLETERLERCPNAFVFYDPWEDRVNSVPVCAWPQHKTKVLRRIAEYYQQAGVR